MNENSHPVDDELLARLTGARLVMPENVVVREFSAETVVLNLESGMYHGLNATAGHMLEHLAANGDFQATVAAIAEQYEVPVERVRADLIVLCDRLIARGLLELETPT